jgi:hypothetical protein
MASADRVWPLISMSRRPHARRAVSRPRWRSPRRLYVVLNREHDPGLRRRSPSDQLSPRGVACRMGEMAGEAAERLHRRRQTYGGPRRDIPRSCCLRCFIQAALSLSSSCDISLSCLWLWAARSAGRDNADADRLATSKTRLCVRSRDSLIGMKRAASGLFGVIGILAVAIMGVVGLNAARGRTRQCGCLDDCWCKSSPGRHVRWLVPAKYHSLPLRRDQ